MTTVEEEMQDHVWSCEECKGLVLSLGFLANIEWGECGECGMKQMRPDEDP